jgi:hypothetical protein
LVSTHNVHAHKVFLDVVGILPIASTRLID